MITPLHIGILIVFFVLSVSLCLIPDQKAFAIQVDRGAFAAQNDNGLFAGNYSVNYVSNSSLIPLDWSHDGTFVTAFDTFHTGIFTLNLGTGNSAQLLSTDTTYKLQQSNQTVKFDYFISTPRLSPSDNRILFSAYCHINGQSNSTIENFIFKISNQTLTKITFNAPSTSYPIVAAWLSDDRFLFTEQTANSTYSTKSPDTLWVADANGNELKKLLTTDYGFAPEVSQDGKKIVFFKNERIESMDWYRNVLMMYDLDSCALRQIGNTTNVPVGGGLVRISPNGQFILFTTTNVSGPSPMQPPGGGVDIASMDGKLLERIVPLTYDEPSLPVVSPDGSSLLMHIEGYTSLSESTFTKSGLYQFQLAHPMPEFSPNFPVLFIAAIASISMVVLRGLYFRASGQPLTI